MAIKLKHRRLKAAATKNIYIYGRFFAIECKETLCALRQNIALTRKSPRLAGKKRSVNNKE